MAGKGKKSKHRKRPVKKATKRDKKLKKVADNETAEENTDLEDTEVSGDEPPPSSFLT
jgi:hypothetical protein